MTSPAEREFDFYPRGQKREELLTNFRIGLRQMTNPDTGAPFTETEIATATAAYVEAVGDLPTHVIDTRKTTPGLRVLERYAVRVGGGRNHRFNLSDGALVKDNHLVALRNQGIGTVEALRMLRDRIPHTARVQVEVDRLDQIPEVLEAGVDAILFDNFTPDEVREAVRMVGGRAVTKMSGGVKLDTVRAYAEAGVNVVSSGALTHSTPAWQSRHSDCARSTSGRPRRGSAPRVRRPTSRRRASRAGCAGSGRRRRVPSSTARTSPGRRR